MRITPIDPEKPFRHFADETEIDRAVLLRPEFLAGEFQVEVLLARRGGSLNSRARLRERALRGHIVDGHGDLRPEHICLTDPVVIFDRLEFSADLRLVDPFDELSFLGLECAILAAPRVGPDTDPSRGGIASVGTSLGISSAFTALRAVLRARLSLARLLDPVPREPVMDAAGKAVSRPIAGGARG